MPAKTKQSVPVKPTKKIKALPTQSWTKDIKGLLGSYAKPEEKSIDTLKRLLDEHSLYKGQAAVLQKAPAEPQVPQITGPFLVTDRMGHNTTTHPVCSTLDIAVDIASKESRIWQEIHVKVERRVVVMSAAEKVDEGMTHAAPHAPSNGKVATASQ